MRALAMECFAALCVGAIAAAIVAGLGLAAHLVVRSFAFGWGLLS